MVAGGDGGNSPVLVVAVVVQVALVVMVVQNIMQVPVEMEELVFKFHRHSEIRF